MIIRADEDLRRLVFIPDDKLLKLVTADGSGPRVKDLSHLLPYLPQWLKEALEVGNVITISPEEFSELDYEVREHIDVLKP